MSEEINEEPRPPSDVEKPFMEHLSELVSRMRVVLFSIAVATLAISILPANIDQIITFKTGEYELLVVYLMNVTKEQLLPKGTQLIAMSWVDTIAVYFLIAILIGVIITAPITAYEFYKFVNPALFPHERAFLYPFMASFMTLFIGGVIYAYYILLPVTYRILLWFVYGAGILPLFSVMDFYQFTFLSMVGSGFFFTLPVIIVLMVKFGMINADVLKKNRTKVFIGVLVLTAVITPDPTPLSMVLLSAPFIILYQISIIAAERTTPIR